MNGNCAKDNSHGASALAHFDKLLRAQLGLQGHESAITKVTSGAAEEAGFEEADVMGTPWAAREPDVMIDIDLESDANAQPAPDRSSHAIMENVML